MLIAFVPMGDDLILSVLVIVLLCWRLQQITTCLCHYDNVDVSLKTSSLP